MSLTHRQVDLVLIIERHHTKHGFAPSVRELQAATGVASMSTIHRDLVALRDEGLIEWDTNRNRTIRVTSNA